MRSINWFVYRITFSEGKKRYNIVVGTWLFATEYRSFVCYEHTRRFTKFSTRVEAFPRVNTHRRVFEVFYEGAVARAALSFFE